MHDKVFRGFLNQQLAQGMKLSEESDLLDLLPLAANSDPPDRYLAKFYCKGIVRSEGGEIVEASEFHVGIWFPSDYLRHVRPFETLTWLHPFNAWHPNVLPPAICVGKIPAGTELVDLLYQAFEIITYNTWASHDALNREAAQWARNNQHRFPIDRRPLKRRTLQLTVQDEVKIS